MRLLAIVFVLAICAATVSPLSAEPCDVGVAGLDQLLDRVLPISARPVWSNGIRKITSVRYTPVDSSVGESLVTFVEEDDGSVSVKARRLRQPLSIEVDAIVDGEPHLSCLEIEKRLTIDEVPISGAPSVRLRRLHERLLNTKIKADASGDIYLDAARFDYVVSGGMANIALTLFSSSTEGRRTHPLLLMLSEIVDIAGEECDRYEALRRKANLDLRRNPASRLHLGWDAPVRDPDAHRRKPHVAMK